MPKSIDENSAAYKKGFNDGLAVAAEECCMLFHEGAARELIKQVDVSLLDDETFSNLCVALRKVEPGVEVELRIARAEGRKKTVAA